MATLFYRACLQCVRYIQTQTIKQVILHADRAQRDGGFVLACTHVSHWEPIAVSLLVKRQVFWMSRIEFFRFKLGAAILRRIGAFPVNRRGISVSAIRKAVEIARRGDIMGIFPEGGCVKGRDLIVRGAPAKGGMATIALKAQVPVLPVVVLGTHTLKSLDPWMPALRGRIWIAVGKPVHPPQPVPRHAWRATRQSFTRRIEQEFISTYQELLAHAKLKDSMTP